MKNKSTSLYLEILNYDATISTIKRCKLVHSKYSEFGGSIHPYLSSLLHIQTCSAKTTVEIAQCI